MDYNYLVFLIGVLVIIISFGVILNIKPIREKFTQTDKPIEPLNTCGRKLSFPFHGDDTKNLAAYRAAIDTDILRDMTPGSCTFSMNNGGFTKPAETLSVVKDNYLYYSLKKTCIGMKCISSHITSTGRAILTFNAHAPEAKHAFAYFILLNPMFVEFSLNSRNNTVAYTPIFDLVTNLNSTFQTQPQRNDKYFLFTTYSKNADEVEYMLYYPTISFDLVMPRSNKNGNTLFSYATDATPYIEFGNLGVPSSQFMLSLQTYYLDDNMPSSLQNIGRQLVHPQKGENIFALPYLFNNNIAGNNLLVYRASYATDQFIRSRPDVYEFYNFINVFYKNTVLPVFTLSMDVSIGMNAIDDNSNKVIAKMYMDNGYGDYGRTCTQVRDLPGRSNNNIFMLVASRQSAYPNSYQLYLVMGKNNKCNFNQEIQWESMTNCILPCPAHAVVNSARLIFTISANEMKMTMFWKEPDTGETHVVFSKSAHCANDTHLAYLFGNQNHPTDADIVMNIDKSIIKKVQYIALGHKNLAAEYNAYL